jgi:hypothetical protein
VAQGEDLSSSPNTTKEKKNMKITTLKVQLTIISQLL